MKVIAAIEADFSRGALGTRSRLNDDLLGESILRRTLKRVLAAERVAGVHLVVCKPQQSQAEAAADGLPVRIETHDAGVVPWRSLVGSGRKWSLDAWRGGLAGTTVFDESMNPWVLEALTQREQADGVVSIPAAAPLFDPALLDRMIAYYETVREDMRMTFTQSAPGLAGVIFMPSLLGDMTKFGQPIGQAMAYQPAEPRRDMVAQSCFYAAEAEIIHAVGRCIADTQAAVDRIAAMLRETGCGDGTDGHVPDALAVSRWLKAHRYADVGSLPEEVEIELTTDDPLPDTTLRPRGKAVGRRGPMEVALFERLIDELAARDDVRIVLGGFGDPLRHPEWARLVARCRRADIFGVAVRTPAVELDERAIQTLITARVDVLNVLIDAVTPETYRKLHQADYFDRVIANLDRLREAMVKAGQPQPLIVPEMTKTRATMSEMERFYDHWLSKAGSAVLAGPSNYAGQWPDLAVMRMAPPARFACQRIFHRAMVLADGRVTVCDQDYRGAHAIGSLADSSLSALWTHPAMASVRKSHIERRLDGTPLCPACDEWHRP